MFSLLLTISRWIARRLLWLIVITGVLWAGWHINSQLTILRAQEAGIPFLEQNAQSLVVNIKEQTVQAEQSIRQLKRGSLQQLDDRITELSKQIDAKLASLAQLDTIINRVKLTAILESAKLKVEIEIARQERDYLAQLKKIQVMANTTVLIASQCEAIRQKHVAAFDLYKAAGASLNKLKIQAGVLALLNPSSDAYKERQSLEQSRTDYTRQTRILKQEYDQCLTEHRASQQAHLQANRMPDFVLEHSKIQSVISELKAETLKIREAVDKHWIRQVVADPLKEILPTALGILALTIAVPVGIKVCLFFVLAPIASRQRAICLMPGSASDDHLPEKHPSAVSLVVSFSTDTELLVKPAYLHSAPQRCNTTSRLGLNRRFFFTNFAADMFTLTQVRCDEPASVTVSAGHDMLNELVVIRLTEGEAVSIRPKNLVGVIHLRNKPLRLSSHWRLGSLQAWLSMQLRYLVLHGPAEIIVKGHRGVRVEDAVQGRAVDQGATIGFSAHLNYAVCRTETFLAYLTGEKGLLRDRFSGANGFYIYEEMPHGKGKSRTTRGIEGLTDSVLKVFGI